MKRSPGFSLVEVTMALGVISFALVALVGMLPVGMSNFRQAIDNQTQAEIVQQVASEVQVMSFRDLSDPTAYLTKSEFFPKYFDERGGEVEASDPNRLYTVRSQPATNPKLPGASSYAASLLVLNFEILKKTAPKVTNVFSLTVSDNGF